MNGNDNSLCRDSDFGNASTDNKEHHEDHLEKDCTSIHRIKSIAPPSEFASYRNVLNVPESSDDDDFDFRSLLEHDLRLAHSSQNREDDEAYSGGETYFIESTAVPNCFLEALALKIFHFHVETLKIDTDKCDTCDDEGKLSDHIGSGVEWWTLVMDDDESECSDDGSVEPSEVGLHYDADYGLESESNGEVVMHPLLATVTYFSDYGAPTCIFNVRGANDVCVCDPLKGNILGIDTMYCSSPAVGKHIVFDGSLIHGAPASIFASPLKHEICKSDNGFQNKGKRRKISKRLVRMTFLANIWLGHRPVDADRLSENLAKSMKLNSERLVPHEENRSFVGQKKGSEEMCAHWHGNSLDKDELNSINATDQLESTKTIEAEIASRQCEISFLKMPPKTDVQYGKSVTFKWKDSSCSLKIGRMVLDDSD